jgi:ubiquinone/menaquinone biosynthesis C-methylase UbiE
MDTPSGVLCHEVPARGVLLAMSIKDFFRSEWAGVAEAWERWGPAVRAQSAAATQWIVELAGVREGMAVLDLAGGTGDPALALARRVGPGGRVVTTDLVPGALELTARAARAAGLAQLRTEPADMEALPFADASFDAVTCRLGLMFCPRPAVALAEARRVLRPGGRAAFVVWGDPAQPLFAATLGQVGRALAAATAAGAPEAEACDGPAPDLPGPFRFADPARLRAALEAAGFSAVSVEERILPWPFAGGGADLWRMFLEMGGPTFQRQLEALDEISRRALDEGIAAALDAHRRGEVVDPTARVTGGSAVSRAT